MNSKRWGIGLLIAAGVVLVSGYLLAVFADVTFIPFLAIGLGWIVAGATTLRRAQRIAASPN
jgi:hypothetical protein